MVATRRQLLAVMFTDIVGYSAMVNRDERAAQRLLEAQREAVRRHVFRHGGETVDIIGDGHLVTFPSARAALECAVELQRAFARRNATAARVDQLRLRIGVHIGDIERSPGRVFGDGVNVAARLEPLAPHGGIAASDEAVAQLHGPLRGCFVRLGERQLKNIAERHEVFILEEGGLEAAAIHLPRISPVRLAVRRYGAVAASCIVAISIAASGYAWYSGWLDKADEASIAVLPLENLSGDKDSADFVAGLHDSLLTEISTMPLLKVISRTSVLRYAHDAPPVPQIARALDVSYVLEGSVQRSAQRVRINVQLIRARTDQHIWARTYDRDAGDLFDVQAQIAREIARSTQGRVVMDAAPAAKRPTTSVEAYDLYLRAIALEDNDSRLGREPATAQIGLLEQAVALDPQFALAWAALARYEIWSANWAAYVEPARKPAYLAAAGNAAQHAMALAPRQAESLLAAGLVAYWKGEDKAGVARTFEEALASRPGYSLALFWLGNVYDRIGDTAHATAALEKLRSLDPYNERVYTQIAQEQQNLRQYEELQKTYAQWREITETPDFVDLWIAELAFFRTGDLSAWKAIIARPPGKGVTQADIDYARDETALYERRWADAIAPSRAAADAVVQGRSDDVEPAVSVGIDLSLSGDAKAAAPYLKAALPALQRTVREDPDNPGALVELASVETELGFAASALAHVAHAEELSAPKSGQKASPMHYAAALAHAQALARLGHKAEALAKLDWLMREPSAVHAHAVLRDPRWMPLDKDPDFTALVKKYLPA